nr:putative reverse transcriptase domain-containing protein [Tanacetum cinerariifolium]
MPGGSLQLVMETLVEPSHSWSNIDEENLDLCECNVKQCKKIYDGYYIAAVRVRSSSGVSPYNEATLEDLKTKQPFKPSPSLPHTPIDHHQLIASPAVVLDMIKSFPRGTSCGRDGCCSSHASSQARGSICPIAVGTIWRSLVSMTSVSGMLFQLVKKLILDLTEGAGQVVIEATQRKRVKYEAKCTYIGYGFLPFSFSSFGEVKKDALTLLKWIRRFSVTQDIRAQWGDHAVHCSSEVEVRMDFLSEDENDLRPADLLLFNWLICKDACLDVTCISSFAGMGATSWAHRVG